MPCVSKPRPWASHDGLLQTNGWAHLRERLSCDESRMTLRTMASSLSGATAASSSSLDLVRFSLTVQIL